MFTLQKLNVVKIVNTEAKRDNLLSSGFNLVKEKEASNTSENIASEEKVKNVQIEPVVTDKKINSKSSEKIQELSDIIENKASEENDKKVDEVTDTQDKKETLEDKAENVQEVSNVSATNAPEDKVDKKATRKNEKE